jgi:outer membrane protein
MRLKLLPLALVLAATPLLGHSEDLLDAYREARANDPTLAQSDASRLATAENVPQARALLLPQLSAGLSLQQQSGNGQQAQLDPTTGALIPGFNSGHVRSRTPSVTLSQSVLDFSKYADLKVAHSQVDAQNEAYQAALQDLYIRVATAYFGVLTSADQLTFAQANEEAFRQTFEQSDQRYKVGLSAITDVYQSKASYESAKADTIAAQNTLNDAREALTQITGTASESLKKLREQLPMEPPTPNDPDAWVKQALASNPTILSQQYSVTAAEHSISAARAGHLPTINLTASRGKTTSWSENPLPPGIDSSTGNGRYSSTIGLTLSVPIFEGGLIQSQVRQAIANRDGAQDGLEVQRRAVIRNTLNDFRTVLAGIPQVEAAKAAVDSAQKALDASRAGFQVGTQTLLDVLTAIQTLTSSQSSYSQTRHQFILNKLLLKQSTGTIDVKDLEQVNSLLE